METKDSTKVCENEKELCSLLETITINKRKGRGQVESGLTHECGVFGAIGCGEWPTDLEIAQIICWGLVALQHRYIPGQDPNKMAFPTNGVQLESLGTNCTYGHCSLKLRNLTRHHSSGAYKCEISSEAPAFRLASETHNVTVAGKLLSVKV